MFLHLSKETCRVGARETGWELHKLWDAVMRSKEELFWEQLLENHGNDQWHLILQIRSGKTLPVKDKIVNILGFMGHMWSPSQLLTSAVVG